MTISVNSLAVGLVGIESIIECIDSAGIPYMIGSTMETSISSAASLHLGLVCPGLKYFDVSPPTTFLVKDVAERLTWKGCDVQPNEMPGLGLKLKEETIAKYRIS